ncbi:MAG: hypothetical protein KC561_19760, partial [Myxococcales bacterium]|nr:hypothetical protein [Myxococcales bacterium]
MIRRLTLLLSIALMASAIHVNSAHAVDLSNLLLYSSFDAGVPSVPGVTTRDVVGANHAISDGNALVVDGSPPADRITSINYTGTDADLTDFGNVLDVGTNNQSISLWFNPTDIDGTQFIASKGNNGSGDNGWSMWLSNDTLIMRGEYTGSDNATQNLGVNIGGITPGQWYHAGVVIDNSSGT